MPTVGDLVTLLLDLLYISRAGWIFLLTFFVTKILLVLPPSNEVWGKVVFLRLSVSHSVHRGCGEGGCPGDVVDTPLNPDAGTPPTQRQTPSPIETATEAGGTHPTGMHSC